jgi:segregation and condensation protein B
MNDSETMPSLKKVLGAMIFAANRSLSIAEMRRCLAEVGQDEGGVSFASVRDPDIAAALEELKIEMDRTDCGFELQEVAGGYGLRSDPSCGRWLRHLLDAGRPNRLSRPALETLAVIAYRQPLTRADIEAIRGVAVDHVIRTLMEMQLVRITGRSELPGRPFLYGTTHFFLDHFGLKDLGGLAEVEPGLRRKTASSRKQPAVEAADGAPSPPAVADASQESTAEAGRSASTEGAPSASPEPRPEHTSAQADEDEYDDDDDEDDEDEQTGPAGRGE